MKRGYLNKNSGKQFHAIIEVHSHPTFSNTIVSGHINWFVLCPVGQTLNDLAGDSQSVARFVVRWKRSQNMRDKLERLRYKNYLFASEIYRPNGNGTDL